MRLCQVHSSFQPLPASLTVCDRHERHNGRIYSPPESEAQHHDEIVQSSMRAFV